MERDSPSFSTQHVLVTLPPRSINRQMDHDNFNDTDKFEDETEEQPTMAQKLVGQLQDVANWYGTNVHPYLQAVKAPVGYVLWCALTIGLIAGLPTAKAISSDPFTELSVQIQMEQELEQARAASAVRPQRR